MLVRSSKQLPEYNSDSVAFWTGGARGQLLINRCENCHKYHHPPAPVCRYCQSVKIRPHPVSGRAELVSYTVNYQPWLPGMKVPFVIGYVAIFEQPDLWLMTNIVDCEIEDITIGMPVSVRFEQQEEIAVPLFAPDNLG